MLQSFHFCHSLTTFSKEITTQSDITKLEDRRSSSATFPKIMWNSFVCDQSILKSILLYPASAQIRQERGAAFNYCLLIMLGKHSKTFRIINCKNFITKKHWNEVKNKIKDIRYFHNLWNRNRKKIQCYVTKVQTDMKCIKPYEAKGPRLITPEGIDEGILGWIRLIACEGCTTGKSQEFNHKMYILLLKGECVGLSIYRKMSWE